MQPRWLVAYTDTYLVPRLFKGNYLLAITHACGWRISYVRANAGTSARGRPQLMVCSSYDDYPLLSAGVPEYEVSLRSLVSESSLRRAVKATLRMRRPTYQSHPTMLPGHRMRIPEGNVGWCVKPRLMPKGKLNLPSTIMKPQQSQQSEPGLAPILRSGSFNAIYYMRRKLKAEFSISRPVVPMSVTACIRRLSQRYIIHFLHFWACSHSHSFS